MPEERIAGQGMHHLRQDVKPVIGSACKPNVSPGNAGYLESALAPVILS
jgi:hypothetical protein